MAVLQVNPTRMVLSTLKKRLAASVRGHRLLKDKRDDLMKKFLELIRENRELRMEMERRMADVHAGFAAAGAIMEEAVLQEALMLPRGRIRAEVTVKNVMGAEFPDFTFSDTGGNGNTMAENSCPYGFAFTAAELDDSAAAMQSTLPLLLKLAQTEKTASLLAAEIEKTRRRVNALEYVQIPTLQETIKSITMKLDENERGNLARLMKVKDMMIRQQREAAED